MCKAVITGIGVVSSVGIGKDKYIEALRNGISGFKEMKYFKVPENRKYAATIDEIPYDTENRCDKVLKIAVDEAISDSKLEIYEKNNYAILMGTMAGDSRSAEEEFFELKSDLNENDKDKVKDSLVRYQMSSLIDNLAEEYNIQGARMVATNACASSNIILGYALDLIRRKETDVVIACGIDLIREVMFWGCEGLNILGDELKPFDQNRKGTVLGEGAGVLIIESEDTAKKRRAGIYCELSGYGISCDTQIDMIVPQDDGLGMSDAIESAVRDSDIPKDEIDYINAHGTGTKNIDKVETRGIKHYFGKRSRDIPVSSTKSIIGHSGGAGGILEAIATVIAIYYKFYPPTLNYSTPDPELDLDYVINRSREGDIRSALSLNIGGGGVNSVTAFTKYSERKGKDNNNLDDVVITGLGIISPLGNTVSEYVKNYNSMNINTENFPGRDSTDAIECLKVKNFDSKKISKDKSFHRNNLAAQYVVAAAIQAYNDAELFELGPKRVGVLVGTSYGGYTTTAHELCSNLKYKGPNYITPYFLLGSGHNLGASLIAKECHIEGMYSTITTGITSGIDAMIYAESIIQSGRMDAVIVGGVDFLDQYLYDAYKYLDVYDKNDFFLSEGAGAVILESKKTAQKRNAHIYGKINSHKIYADTVGRGKIDTESKSQLDNINYLLDNTGNCKNVFSHNLNHLFDEKLGIINHRVEKRVGEAHAATSMFAAIKLLTDDSIKGYGIVCASAFGGMNSAISIEKY